MHMEGYSYKEAVAKWKKARFIFRVLLNFSDKEIASFPIGEQLKNKQLIILNRCNADSSNANESTSIRLLNEIICTAVLLLMARPCYNCYQ